MRARFIAALLASVMAVGLLASNAEAQGRFWVLVNGALRYTGLVTVQANATGQALSTTATWTDVGTTYTHWLANVTDTASASASKLLDLQVGGTSQFNVSKAGALVALGSINAGTGSAFRWASRSSMVSPSDGVITIGNNGVTDFSRLQFGGTTSAFPSLKRNGTTLEAKLADDSAYASFAANRFFVSTAGGYSVGSALLIGGAAPTIASGFGTTPSIAANNGTAAFTVNVGTGGTASSGVLTMPAAATGWICHVENGTAVAANRADQRTVQTASTTTSVTVQNQTVSTGAALAWTASNVLVLSCFAY